MSPLFIQDQSVINKHSHNFRYGNTAEVPRPTTRYGIQFLRCEAAKLWNSLANEARNDISYNEMAKIPKSDQSRNISRNYKSESIFKLYSKLVWGNKLYMQLIQGPASPA
jgi:hypothetical protein